MIDARKPQKENVVKHWVCSSCGREDVTEAPSHPSLDDRFAVGYCPSCTPDPAQATDPKKRARSRSTVPLVSRENWDPAIVTERKARRADELFLSKYRDGKIDANDPKNRERAFALIARYDAERQARAS